MAAPKQNVATVTAGPSALQLPEPQRQFLQMIKLALTQQMPVLAPLMPNQQDKAKFISNIMTAIVNSKDGTLFKCTPQSILHAAREAVEFGLSLNPQRKQADLIPRWNSKINGYEAQFQVRFGGLMTLALRSGEVKKISSTAVREGDHFEWERGLTPKLVHRPKLNNKGPLIAAYCVWVLADDTSDFDVIDQQDIERAKKASQSKNRETGEFYGPWKDDEEEMWRKTAVRRASKYMPSSAEDFQKAVQMDTLRDIGHEVVVEDGEIIDVTEAAPPVAPAAAAKQQLDNLEGKVAQKKPAAPKITVVAVPRNENGDPEYGAWVAAVLPAVRGQPKAFRDAWRQAHDVMIEGGEMTAPDVMEELMNVLGGQ